MSGTLRFLTFGIVLVALVACGEEQLVLDGPRFDIRDDLPQAGEARPVQGNADAPRAFAAPPQVNHTAWTHRNGKDRHQIDHPALGSDLRLIWTANIGDGDRKRGRITADPVVAGNRIFTLDSSSRVSATSTSGASLWSRGLVPAVDDAREATGGGLAVGEGLLFATTGFGELFAINPETGATVWRQRLDAPVTASPTVSDGLVYVISRDNQAWALDVTNGRIRWQLAGTPSDTAMIGGAGPVINGRLVVFPFSSGEMSATLKRSGIRVWSSSVAGERRGRAYASFSDITGDPVVANGRLYAGNQSGRTVALNAGSGERIWTASEGAYSPVWPAGDSLFLISDQAELVRLDAETGERIWGTELPYFTRSRLKRRKAVFAHYGPVLAGGRLIVASNDGQIRSFDPETGALVGRVSVNGGASANPAVVDRTLYVVTGRGQLAAFR
ncbi:outer membrane protein assembly factor BamB family protein [Litoreibacter roseus]|uniref:Pyrrolo-quinoline quinone n=1 Tax=Litoreibacter roseus TaxID=2601869 RepID=A0A6N6JCW3_9RHOB|nr:PQQ-binding-like beta-propeller repeat protein [Litoreibacter roseus]GFE64006.1 pyrrolo-quinoline quinone [Litoreibacter roseus]